MFRYFYYYALFYAYCWNWLNSMHSTRSPLKATQCQSHLCRGCAAPLGTQRPASQQPECSAHRHRSDIPGRALYLASLLMAREPEAPHFPCFNSGMGLQVFNCHPFHGAGRDACLCGPILLGSPVYSDFAHLLAFGSLALRPGLS